MSVFFTSDLHLGHRKVAELRGFASSIDHDKALVEEWRKSVTDRDDVWVLGDIAASSPTYALEVLQALPGRKHLIWGNHDRGHPMHRNAHNQAMPYFAAFESVAQSARRRIDGVEVLLSHFPYERDRDEARHMQWRLRDEGSPLLHGHTHGPERLTVKGIPVPDTGDFFRDLLSPRRLRVEIHVGLDAWGHKLVPLETVSALLKEGTK